MAKLHSIRLHGPWHARVLDCYQSDQAEFESNCRLKIPSDWADWLGPSFRGRVEFRRSFNVPTGLQPAQPVWLVVESVDDRATVLLNGQTIGTWHSGEPPLRVNVSEQLRSPNELLIQVEVPVQPNRGNRESLAGGLTGEIRLEIEE